MYVYTECAQRAADSIGCSATSDVPYVNKGVLYRCEVYTYVYTYIYIYIYEVYVCCVLCVCAYILLT